jgi:[ribosomal protein S5]-alanine N-acetyltransferase
MNQEIKTERLILKPIDENDLEFIYQEFSNDFINRYLYDFEPMVNIDEAKAVIDFYINTKKYYNHRYILMIPDGTKIGTLGYHNYNIEQKTIEIGYDLKEAFNGLGYMTEALHVLLGEIQKVVDVSFIQAVIYKDNLKSIKLVETLGFLPMGIKYETFRGQSYEHIIYQLEVDSYQKRLNHESKLSS